MEKRDHVGPLMRYGRKGGLFVVWRPRSPASKSGRCGGKTASRIRGRRCDTDGETTGTVWLGLTLTCARCHSHKYDPISQREYYQMFAFMNNWD